MPLSLKHFDGFKLNLSIRDKYDRAFLFLLLADTVLRVIWLNMPSGSLIFDEWYYVNVARVILGIPQSIGSTGNPPYQNVPIGLDPNHEHPPLAKLLIALSMYVLGDNGYGWRIPSVVFGVFAVLIFYLLLKRISEYKFVPLLGAFLFSFDNLVFVHSRIATLDIFTVTFMILGVYWYFSGHPYLSAIGMALSTLSKTTGVAGVIIIVAIHAVRFVGPRKSSRDWSRYFSWFERYIAAYAISFLVLLTILDRLWVGYDNAFPHLQFILTYSSALVSSCPNGIISCPWQWLINQVQIPYLVVNVSVTAGSVTKEFNSIAFMGAMNPSVLYLTLPAIAYSGYVYWRQKKDIALLSLIWFIVTYLPYYPAVIFGNRVTYIFYFLPAIPAVCTSISYMIADQNPPKLVVLFYLGVVLVSFYFLFPFKVVP